MNGRIVVGVDGSGHAREAVRWAAKEALLRDMRLELVSTWEVPLYAYAFADGIAGVPGEVLKSSQERAEADLEIAIREARSVAKDVEIETIAAQGQPADVLLQVSQGADLLVVGSRGLGGFRGLLLGSVSQQCVHHAACPVAVVRFDQAA